MLSAVATRIIAPRVFKSSVFCAWVFLNVLCSQAILIHLSYYVILIVLVCTLFQCKFGYFSYSEYFVSDDLLSRISSWPLLSHVFHSFINNYSTFVTPEERPGMSDVSPLSGISGLSFDSTLLSTLLFFRRLVLFPFLSYLFLPAGPFF